MSRINTRASNKDKHPGEVDLSPQRRTNAPKKASDNISAEERQAQEESRKAVIRRLAEVEARSTQKQKTLMGPGPGPRTVPKDHGRPTTATKTDGPPAENSGKHTLLRI